MDRCTHCIHREVCSYKYDDSSLVCADNFADIDQYLKIPFLIGDLVYKIHKAKDSYWINTYRVAGAHLRDGDSYLVVRHVNSKMTHHIPFSQINVTVFKSKTKANEVLKELKKG